MKVGDIIQLPPFPGEKGEAIREPINTIPFPRRSNKELIESLIGKTFVVKGYSNGSMILEPKRGE